MKIDGQITEVTSTFHFFLERFMFSIVPQLLKLRGSDNEKSLFSITIDLVWNKS